MAKFDAWDTNTSESQFLNPQDLDREIFSDTDINILSTWADINGLGESIFDLSDGNAEIAMQGMKIALIIALSVAASSLTM
jgi:hypothetical protein